VQAGGAQVPAVGGTGVPICHHGDQASHEFGFGFLAVQVGFDCSQIGHGLAPSYSFILQMEKMILIQTTF
jgi:hypothetical protein